MTTNAASSSTAILVQHAPVFPAFGYRFDTPTGSVAFSGDTGECENVVRLAKDADVLVHEVIDLPSLECADDPPAQLRVGAQPPGELALDAGAGRPRRDGRRGPHTRALPPRARRRRDRRGASGKPPCAPTSPARSSAASTSTSSLESTAGARLRSWRGSAHGSTRCGALTGATIDAVEDGGATAAVVAALEEVFGAVDRLELDPATAGDERVAQSNALVVRRHRVRSAVLEEERRRAGSDLRRRARGTGLIEPFADRAAEEVGGERRRIIGIERRQIGQRVPAHDPADGARLRVEADGRGEEPTT